MKIKIKIQNKFYFWLKSKIEKKKSIEQKAKKKNQKNRNQIEKTNIWELNDEIKNK